MGTVLGAILVAGLAWSQAGEDHPVNRWVQQSPREGAPAPRFGWEGSGAYDPSRGAWIHHAGHDGNPQGFVLFTFDLGSGRWRQHFPPTSPPGVCCVDGSNVFDPVHDRLVRFPGGSLGHGYQWSRGVRLKNSAVWLYDPGQNRWTNMRPRPYKAPKKYSREVVGGLCAGATYDPNHQVAISFGGSGSGGAKNVLFAYDVYANELTRMKAENPPPMRDGMGLAYDTVHDKLVMFGSQYLSDGRTWLYDFKTNAWESHEVAPHPPAKKGKTYSTIPKMAYDSRSGVHLCLAWQGEKGGHETWIFDAGALKWTKMNPEAEPAPSKSRSRNLVYAPALNLFILETTAVTGGPQIWTYRYKNAPVPPAPPADLRVVTGPGKAELTWKASPGAREYSVYRADEAPAWKLEYRKIGTTRETGYTDSGLEKGRVYSYGVRAKDGRQGPRARTQPRVLLRPTVSVRGKNKVEVRWNAHPAPDVAGYNVYRGTVSARTVLKGKPQAWRDNDPEYDAPRIAGVTDITDLRKLNDVPITDPSYEDSVDFGAKGPESGDYPWAVYAYIVHAVNRLGTESGPSPYALTIPSEPLNVLCREDGTKAHLKWDANPEKGLHGYHVYRMEGGVFGIVRVTEKPIEGTAFTHEAGSGTTRYWVVAVDALGQEGQPSSPAWFGRSYTGFFDGAYHQ